MEGDFINKKTVALTVEQYKEILSVMKEGFCGSRPNPRAATALMLEANLGLRISDIVRLRLCDIVSDDGRYRLAITEKKTKKARMFTVPFILDTAMLSYAEDFGLDAVSWAVFALPASPDALPDWPLALLPLAEPAAVFDWADLFCMLE